MRLLSLIFIMTQPGALVAQIPVTDASVLVKVIEQVVVTTEQLNQLKMEIERLGNPAAVKPAVAADLARSIAKIGVGRTLEDLRWSADGLAALAYDGDGLYRPLGPVITTSDGQQHSRSVESYRKFDAVTQAKATLEEVMRDTDQRRDELKQQIQLTLSQVQAATTVAEVQKLLGVLTALNSQLGAVDRERDTALGRLLASQIENQSDTARQAEAQREERVVDFRFASKKVGAFLTPETAPVRIPNTQPRQP